MRGTPDFALVHAVQQFLYRECRLLDERRFSKWVALFAEDGIYWLPHHAGQDDPTEHVSIIYEDRAQLALRTRRLQHASAHAVDPPAITVRMLSNIEVREDTGPAGVVHVNCVVALISQRSDERMTIEGRARYELRANNTAEQPFEILLKRVDLVQSAGTMLPIPLPV